MRQFTALPPLALYLHLPWCIRKCPYCDFNSHERRGELPEANYIDALIDDLAAEMPLVWGRTISSVFIGGGTPSLFSADSLDRLLGGVRALTGLTPQVEVTLEANPGTFEQERFSDFRRIGINRLSIGVQSFNDDSLQALGRVHSADEAIGAVDIARTAGFDNLNLDLMYALPEQDLAAALLDVDQALALQPDHLSCYELTLEPNTLFSRFPPALPSDDSKWDMQEAIIEKLLEAGFSRYEVSAFSKPGRRCAHNMNYWLFGDYLGIGAGAHGKLSAADTGTIVRRWKQKHPTRYLEATAPEQRLGAQTTLALQESALEFMMNALRLTDGFPIPVFQTHTGLSLDHWQPAIEAATEAGLLEQRGLSLAPTARGLDLLNDLLAHFMPGAHPTPGLPDSDASQTPMNSSGDSSQTPINAMPLKYPVIPLKPD